MQDPHRPALTRRRGGCMSTITCRCPQCPCSDPSNCVQLSPAGGWDVLLTVVREPEPARRVMTFLMLIAMAAVSLAIAAAAAVAPRVLSAPAPSMSTHVSR